MGNDLDKSRGIAADWFNCVVVLVVKLMKGYARMLKSCFILALIFLVMLGNLAESKENPVGVMPYKYIEWIDLADRKAPEDISNLIIDHLREPYESALEFSKNAPIYTPSVEYVSTDVNKDGEPDVIGRINSGTLCTRHSGCPTVVLIKRKDGSYVESFNEEVLDRLGVTDNGMLIHETRDFDFYKCDMYRLDERGYFNLLSGECKGDD